MYLGKFMHFSQKVVGVTLKKQPNVDEVRDMRSTVCPFTSIN